MNAKPAITGKQQTGSRVKSVTSTARYDLDKLRSRDPQEFDVLVKGESERIQRLVDRLLGWNDVDDVAQEVFIKAWESIDRFRGDASVSTWLYSIAINLCRNQQRRTRIWQKVLRKISRTREQNSRDPTSQWSQVEHVQHAMSQLSHSDRETIVLCCLEEHSVAQVAAMWGTNRNTVEVRLHRARARLKLILDASENE